MNREQLIQKTDAAVSSQLYTRGYTAPCDVLMDIGVLSRKNYEEWRRGRVPYLEKVCACNLSQLSAVNHEIRSIAVKRGLKPSFTYYGMWGAKGKKQLRFSKSGQPSVEKNYATHYVDSGRIAELKAQKNREEE